MREKAISPLRPSHDRRHEERAQIRRSVWMQHSCHHLEVALAFKANVAQSVRHNARSPHRGFVLWRLSDDGPGASRIIAIGRHPKPFTQPEELRVSKSSPLHPA